MELQTNDLKMVKNSHLEKSENVIKIVHYDTVIFEYHMDKKSAWYLKNASRTSDKMVRRALDFFNVDEKNTTFQQSEKWAYSEGLQ